MSHRIVPRLSYRRAQPLAGGCDRFALHLKFVLCWLQLLVCSVAVICSLSACAGRGGHWFSFSQSAPDLTHQVQSEGETLSQISRWYTGKVSNWRKIQAHNPGLDPRNLKIGQSISIPRSLVQKWQAMPRRSGTIVVRRSVDSDAQQLITGGVAANKVESAGPDRAVDGSRAEATASAVSLNGSAATYFGTTSGDVSSLSSPDNSAMMQSGELNLDDRASSRAESVRSETHSEDELLIQEQLREKLFDAALSSDPDAEVRVKRAVQKKK